MHLKREICPGGMYAVTQWRVGMWGSYADNEGGSGWSLGEQATASPENISSLGIQWDMLSGLNAPDLM
jgi:hypothetical protein